MGKRNNCLDPKAREYIITQLHDNGQMTKEEVMDLIRPHFSFDPVAAEERAIGRYANRLVASVRDEAGVRTCFTVQNKDTIVNIEKSKNLALVKTIENQLSRQIEGIRRSQRRAARRMRELEGQISMFGEIGEAERREATP